MSMVALKKHAYASQKANAESFFPLESIQHLGRDDALRCQSLLGHGDKFGTWETPLSLINRHLPEGKQKLDIAKRLEGYIPDEVKCLSTYESLLQQGILWSTKYALLLILGPFASKSRQTNRALDPTTVLEALYQYISPIVAQAINRVASSRIQPNVGLLCHLTEEDFGNLRNRSARTMRELQRLRAIVEQGYWHDQPNFWLQLQTKSAVKGDAKPREKEAISNTYLPLPDEFMAEIGPRIRWLVFDLGPNVVHLSESLPELFKDLSYSPTCDNTSTRQTRLRRYFAAHEWTDQFGHLIVEPPFPLSIGTGRGSNLTKRIDKVDKNEWPPRTYEHIKVLASMVQGAHLWMTFLSTGARVSEVLALKRDHLKLKGDGMAQIEGLTFKLSSLPGGESATWPAPPVLVDALNQQLRLVRAWERIAKLPKDGPVYDAPRADGDHLWASIGARPTSSPDEALKHAADSLLGLAKRVGMNPRPDGTRIHPHRFRKTIARLGALAIVDSPRVLMKLLGHKDISMTLHYILTDKALQLEIEKIARELRVMRCQTLVEDIHSSMIVSSPIPFGGYGGGAPRIVEGAIRAHEEHLHQTGKSWGATSAHELAVILTNNGQDYRVARPGVVCLKGPGEVGYCKSGKGAPDTNHCKTGCPSRIEDKRLRRDVIELIPTLIQQGCKALAENLLLVVANIVAQLEDELARFPDIAEVFLQNEEFLRLRNAIA